MGIKLVTIYETAKAILKGNAIIIRDDGKNCKTFVGEDISKARFRRVLLSHLQGG